MGGSSKAHLKYFEHTIVKVVAKEKAASDPYSIINYGLGGQIEVKTMFIFYDPTYWQLQVHVDYWGEENKREGGITTLETNINGCI